MQIKRFEAASMAEALENVKQTFGTDAIILSARNLTPANGLLRAWRKPKVEVTAAVDMPERYPQDAWPASSAGVTASDRHGSQAAPGGSHPAHAMQRPEGRIREYTRPAADASPAAIYPKRYLKSLFLLDQMMALHEVAAKTRQSLTAQVHQIAVSRNQMQSEDLKVILGALIQQQCTVAASATGSEAGTQAMALIGPTGKGKTTTLAKLAAVEARQYNRRVGLISLDNYRIGGIAQLRIFARIIGVPLLVARDRGEFRAALQRLRSLDKILIDTPGFNPRDRQQIDQLARLLGVAQPLDVHLVCSATTKVADMHESLRQLEQMALSHMIFTKLDESMTHGTVLTHMMQGQLPVSFFTTGPQVPEDIQRASAQAILNRIINPQTERHVWAAAPETLADQREAFEQALMAQQPPLAPYRSFSLATPQPQKASRPARQGQSIMV